MSERSIIFFIGTVAEYIKLFTVIEEVKKAGLPYKIVLSGQNEILGIDIANATSLHADLQLSFEKDIIKNVFGLFSWFFKTLIKSKRTIRKVLCDVDFKNSVFVVHGDTLSTVMGAVLAKELGSELCHVEAGLRSHRWFSPFPEEIDRHLVSTLADYNFCQGELGLNNLSKYHGEAINTKYNTIIDALFYSKQIQSENENILNLADKSYCVIVVHRQENILKPGLVRHIVNKVIEVAQKKTVVFILHQITKNTLVKLNLLEILENTENVILFDRMEYFDFMKLLENSDFVITDGGSNQEELHYMGKPTLVLRSVTERDEGLGKNAILYNDNLELIDSFIDEYKKYSCEETVPDILPSEIICNKLATILERAEQDVR